MNHIAVLVAQNLYFDMAGLLDEFLDQDAVIAERGFRLVARRLEAFAHFVVRAGDAHALAAATGGGLDHHRIANVVGHLDGLLVILDFALEARNRVHARFGGELLGFQLVAHGRDGVRVRTDPGDVLFRQRLGKGRVFRQEAKTGVNRIGARVEAGLNDRVHLQIGFARRGRSDEHRLIGHFHRQRIGISFGIDRHGGNAQPLAGLDDAHSNFAAVGDEDLVEHVRSCGTSDLCDAGLARCGCGGQVALQARTSPRPPPCAPPFALQTAPPHPHGGPASEIRQSAND